MLRNSSKLNGYAIAAEDGHLGDVSDFLFDDSSWLIRWLVVDTGKWFSSPHRKVLLPPSVLGHLDPEKREFAVKLTRQQVKDSPDIEVHRPVSRQMEARVYDYYGWNPYWGSGFYMGGYGLASGAIIAPPLAGSQRIEDEFADAQRDRDDLHLRSASAITGYHIHATDGQIGHAEDFLIEDADWSIHYIVVDTKNWWPAKKVLISPRSVGEISWTSELVNLNVDRQTVKGSPTYDASTTVDRSYEKQLHRYYDAAPPPSAH